MGVAIEAVPSTMEQTASMPGACTRIRHHPRTYHGGGTPAVRPGDILPSAFRDHGFNSEGVSGLHHPNGLVLCREQWCRWRAAAVRYACTRLQALGVYIQVCVFSWAVPSKGSNRAKVQTLTVTELLRTTQIVAL